MITLGMDIVVITLGMDIVVNSYVTGFVRINWQKTLTLARMDLFLVRR